MKIDDDIAELEASLAEGTKFLADLVQKRMDECPHLREDVFQAPYHAWYSGGASPPFRVCRRCGLAEEGWRAYTLLGHFEYGYQTCTRDQGYAWKRGKILSGEEVDAYARSIGRMPPSIIRKELKP